MKKTEFTFQIAGITFSSDDGFHIIKTGAGENVSGKFAARVGLCYKSEGAWETHSKYGPQFKLSSAVAVEMTSALAIGRFLVFALKGSGVGESVISLMVEGVYADKLDLTEMLDKNMQAELTEYVGKRNMAKIDIILTQWPKIKPVADLMSPLLGYGLSPAMAETLIGLFGNSARKQVEDFPYDLMLRVDGISFIKADAIAMKVGRIGKTDPIRLRAALSTGMRDAMSNGDIGVRRKTLIEKTLPLVNESILDNGRRKLAPGIPLVVSRELLMTVLDAMVSDDITATSADDECGFARKLIEFPDEKGEVVVWYAPLVDAEKLIADRLSKFNAKPRLDLVARVAEFAAKLEAKLAPEQQAAIEMVLRHPVSIISGRPGCGKSFLLKVLLSAFDAAGIKGDLCAPTGKAAKRITESTGRKAQTMHTLIGFGGGRKMFDQSCPLASKFLVMDEASMADTELAAAVLEAISNDCRVIIVGDIDQLSSVGPGQVMRDILRANVIPVTHLTKVFRQGPGSGIITAATMIKKGQVPETSDDGQFLFVETDTPALDLLVAVKGLIADGINADDIQVLSPTHKGEAGCTALNKAVQNLLNPEPAGGTNQRLRRDSGDIRVGDRVMQNKNDKELLLVNGDIGWVDGIASDTGTVIFSLPDKAEPVAMKSDQTLNLKLAYAISVHKSQGAEAPYVLLALDASAAFMLRRNLVYTGVTRGSKKVIVFATRNLLAAAVHRGEPAEGSRRTSLVPKLHQAFAGKTAPLFAPVVDELAAAMLSADMPDLPF